MFWNYLWAGYFIACLIVGTYTMIDKVMDWAERGVRYFNKRKAK